MEKASKKTSKEQRFEVFATRPPKLSVLTDHPLDRSQACLDEFDLRFNVGPIFDIVRHEKMRLPMTIAIYGGWGTGKTSAMRWLHGAINTWNDSKASNSKIKLRPVWFYPWKFHNREDVWKGLIAEVILDAMNAKINSKILLEGMKMLVRFLGKSAINIVSSAKVSIKGLEVNGDAAKKIIDDFGETISPERPYLNEFEDTLKTWVKKSLRKKERMVIFIDDLDRCLPEVALEVLEALKLYLNIENLIFVVGIDKPMLEKAVAAQYKKSGVEEKAGTEIARLYLAKMFQVEVTLTPTEQQIEDYLDSELEKVSYWRDYLEKDEKEIFRSIILNRAKKNPREVKRLINSALVRGFGMLLVEGGAE